MPVELVIVPEAELDIAEAYLWYEGRRAGLGEEFLSSVEACLESIRRRPEMYPVVHEGYRRSNKISPYRQEEGSPPARLRPTEWLPEVGISGH